VTICRGTMTICRGTKIMWREWKCNSIKKLVTYLLTRCRREIIVPSEDIQKWVYIHEYVMIHVCVKTHAWPSYSKSEPWKTGFR